MRKRIIALVAAFGVAASLSFVAPQRAEAAQPWVAGTQGCGIDIAGTDFLPLVAGLITPTTVTLNDRQLACVVSLRQLDLGFTTLPIGPAVAIEGTISLSVTLRPAFALPPWEFSVDAQNASVKACVPFAWGIRVTSQSPNSAAFRCLSVVIGTPTGSSPLPSISIRTVPFTAVAASGANDGSINGLEPFKALDIAGLPDVVEDLINNLVNDILSAAIPQLGDVLSPVSVTVRTD